MVTKKHIIIFFIAIGLILLLYLILSSTSVNNETAKNSNNTKVNVTEEEYTNQLKILVNNYKQVISGDEVDVEKIKTVKEDLLSLVVPVKYKDLHIKIILALIKMERFIEETDQTYKIESNNLINEALANNNWLEVK